MAVNLHIPPLEDIHAVPGVQIGVAEAGIRKSGRRDLVVFDLAPDTAVAGVFTRNRFRAAPVQVCERHLRQEGGIRALVINTGNANAGTGPEGMAATETTCRELARLLEVQPQQILPFSTGVILEPLPVDRLMAGLPRAVAQRQPDGWLDAAYGIMTTDTQPKVCSRRVSVAGHPITLTGISKGAGMIRPNMATMLGFLATDAGIAPALLQSLVRDLADHSFNRITVDGDTSTNDSFVVMATGQSPLRVESTDDDGWLPLRAAMIDIARELAQKIVRDAEGATKFISIEVSGAANADEALQVAYAVAHSPLVKTAFYASDPNLGRILAAIGYAGINDLDVAGVNLWLDDVHVASDGGRHALYREEDGERVMQQAEIRVGIHLGRGDCAETVYTCDFSHEYVSINADYRT